MGKGGSSSSSNTTNTTNTNGTSAISGDNLGVVISGVNGNVGNITVTDHGAMNTAESIAKSAVASNASAMKEASDLGKEAIKSNENVTKEALKSNESVSKKALDTGFESLKESLGFGSEALKENSAVNQVAMDNMRRNSEDSINAVKAMAAQSGLNAREALHMAEKTAQRSQTGNSGDMTKVVIAVAGAFGIAAVAFAVTRGRG
ncbi:hypothetical protein VITU102760_12225 [Vibrio tubiashii]|uniref:Chemotaxis protein n=1 Tax=Vibrio tubiashii ATCC 19109 TaxID=1051646 RepID=F9SZY7_9VIBR|nr:hypothetical protein [Vibrio tubiashii]AIW16284.1 hypothetical protein IX91_19510 [Vibrio tubiashii ATCC 19109]EGU59065.1 hypothetical protein VITU9109_18965 [Vibrio tubiashii ATCC 19109]EIF05933.1 hypothetical protein VT1337_00795 [Vibrio tubiashii NCIMB 1337 = ATCC 19106]